MTLEPTDLAGLFEAHKEGLCGAIRGMLGRGAEVQEVLQEVFLRTLTAARAGKIHGDPLGFVFVVTLNHARDLRRRATVANQHKQLDEVTVMGMRAQDPPPTAGVERREAVEAARAAIEHLADREKEVFFLRVGAGLTFEGVADQLGIPVGTAKTRMRHALATLRQRLDGHDPHRTDERGRP